MTPSEKTPPPSDEIDRWREIVDQIDDFEADDDDEDDREAECGRWDNGKLGHQCRLAGTEWCDWECPFSR